MYNVAILLLCHKIYNNAINVYYFLLAMFLDYSEKDQFDKTSIERFYAPSSTKR